MHRAVLTLVALALPLLAGCAAPTDVGAVEGALLGPADLQQGRFYAFHHPGGALSIAAAGNGSGELVLYGADDTRIGRLGLGASGGRFLVDQQPAGELVVEVLALNGTLDLRAGSRQVQHFVELSRHVERHVLLQAPRTALGFTGAAAAPSAEATADLQLLRAPSALRLLLHGVAEGLDVRVTGPDGVVLQAELRGSPFLALGPSAYLLDPLPASVHEENLRGASYQAVSTAASFEGVLVLEAESFSRARAAAPLAQPTDAVPRFTYGVLPDQPVAFDVHPEARHLFLWQDGDACAEECPEAVVHLFGPDDVRVALVHVPANGTVAVPVQRPGSWVAVLASATATLGADRVPADFELHPLTVVDSQHPGQHAGQQGNYGQATAAIELDAVPFRLDAGLTSGSGIGFTPQELLLLSCGPSSLRLAQQDETLGAWGHGLEGPTLDAHALLRDGPLDLVHDDFGPGCPRLVLHVTGYQR